MKPHIQLAAALASLKQPENLFTECFSDTRITVEIYKPEEEDLQSPHDRDELYVIISGSGRFRLRGESFLFKPGDLLFAPAHAPHRFENFTNDFATWVIFYGAAKSETDNAF